MATTSANTSTTAPILPVVRIDGQAVGSGQTGPVVRRLAELTWQEVARQTGWQGGNEVARQTGWRA